MSYSTPNPEQYLSKVHLLIAEDDAILRQLVKTALKRLGFTHISEADDGESALTIMRMHPVDILLCDWEMAPMDGLALVHYIRQHPHSPNPYLPILMMTGRTGMADVTQARDAGITEYLAKPFDMAKLCQRLTSIIEKPRDFVQAPSFTGPDRRRRSSVHYQERDRRDQYSPEVIPPHA